MKLQPLADRIVAKNIKAEAKSEPFVGKPVREIEMRSDLWVVLSFRTHASGAGEFSLQIDDISTEGEMTSLELGDARRVVVDGRGIVGGGSEGFTACGRFGVLVGETNAQGLKIGNSKA